MPSTSKALAKTPNPSIVIDAAADLVRFENEWDAPIGVYLSGLDSEATRTMYALRLSSFAEFCRERGALSPVAVAPALLIEHRRHLVDTSGRSVVAQSIAAVRGFIAWLRAASTAAAHLPNKETLSQIYTTPKRQGDAPISVLSDREVERLLSSLADSHELLDIRDRVIISLMLASGLRVSELVALTRGHLAEIPRADGSAAAVLKVNGKGSKLRTVPLAGDVAELLHSYISNYGRGIAADAPIFARMDPLADGRRIPLTRQAITKMITKRLAAAGVTRDVSPHKLRHTFALRFLRAGGYLPALQRVLGHSSIETTQKYLRALEDAEIVEQMPTLAILAGT